MLKSGVLWTWLLNLIPDWSDATFEKTVFPVAVVGAAVLLQPKKAITSVKAMVFNNFMMRFYTF